MQAAGDLVAAAAELAAGVQDRVDDLEGVLAGRVLADRDAAAVVLDDDQAGMDRSVGSVQPSALIVTAILCAWPAIASSIELSTTSQTR